MLKNNSLSPKEKDIEKVIIKGLRFNGIYCQKVQAGKMFKSYVNRFGEKITYCVKMADEGTPDIFSCVPVKITPDMVGQTFGLFVAVEVKRDEREINEWLKQKDWRSQSQSAQHDSIRDAGGVVVLAQSLNVVFDDLKSIKYLK